MRRFDPRNLPTGLIIWECRHFGPLKNEFKCSIAWKSNKILILWPIDTKKGLIMSISLKVFCPVAFFMHHPLVMSNSTYYYCSDLGCLGWAIFGISFWIQKILRQQFFPHTIQRRDPSIRVKMHWFLCPFFGQKW